MATSFSPPKSYTTLPFSQISLSHHPSSCPTVTPVVIIHIDRVANHNAFTSEMEHDLVRAFHMLDLDERVKAIVVTGKGKNICSRADFEIGLNREEGVGDKEHKDG
jgi:enoyl-CoA hydratase/carnithine racemase